MTARNKLMKDWLESLAYDVSTLEIASSDASFRHYYRIQKQSVSYIIMDAPPEHESCDAFVELAKSLTQHAINAPIIYEENRDQGFLVLSDFGNDLLLGLLNDESVEGLYSDALNVLQDMQKNMPTSTLNSYTSALLDAEMELYREWFLEKLLGLSLNEQQIKNWEITKKILIDNALNQPQIFVHRDFHSRNLLKTDNGQIGVIDFQDAVKGPMTYDLVSLLRDCYIEWPEALVNQFVMSFYDASNENAALNMSAHEFLHAFNLMGVQRHLKAVGIFSRLKLRDHKDGYLADIPRTLNYINQVCANEESLLSLYEMNTEFAVNAKIMALNSQSNDH